MLLKLLSTDYVMFLSVVELGELLCSRLRVLLVTMGCIGFWITVVSLLQFAMLDIGNLIP